MMSEGNESSLVERVQNTIGRLKISNVTVTDLGDGNIVLSCDGTERNEQCLLQAAVLSVVGVNDVKIEAT